MTAAGARMYFRTMVFGRREASHLEARLLPMKGKLIVQKHHHTGRTKPKFYGALLLLDPGRQWVAALYIMTIISNRNSNRVWGVRFFWRGMDHILDLLPRCKECGHLLQARVQMERKPPLLASQIARFLTCRGDMTPYSDHFCLFETMKLVSTIFS